MLLDLLSVTGNKKLSGSWTNRFTSRRTVKNCETRMVISWAANRPDFNEDEVIRRALVKMNRQ